MGGGAGREAGAAAFAGLRWVSVLACALLAAVVVGRAGAAEEPVLDRAAVPAKGRQEAVLTLPGFGRYAVFVKSPQGASLQVVDRMAGPGDVAGAPGKEDGRLDLFLERGSYKVVARSPETGEGEARLEVRAFAEKNGPKPPALVELKPVAESLGDFEQRSYWIQIDEKRTVALEAAGRNLRDLRLWRDGSWLVDAAPARAVIEPVTGRPLLACRLSAELEPGLYLLTAYGGTAQPWPEESGEHPFHLRYGIPTLGVAGRGRYTASPFGVDRWLVPGPATYFRLELPGARPATLPASLDVGPFDGRNPFAPGVAREDIAKNSREPAAEVSAAGLPKGFHAVTVSAAPGEPYVLQHFELSHRYVFRQSGDYWLSTVHTGHAADSVDATGIVARTEERSGRTDREPFVADVVTLDAAHGWARRANLLDTLTVFLRVAQAGKYEILSRGTEAKFRIEPFLLWRPPRYESPSFRGAGSAWDLDAGYHVLTVEPVKRGILDLAVRPAGLTGFVLDRLGLGRDVEKEPVKASLRFPQVRLEAGSSYTLFLNEQPGVRVGVVLRPLPLDLTEPLPVTQRPGEEVKVPFAAREPGTLRARAEDGLLVALSVDGGPWQREAAVAAGGHTVSVGNGGKDTVSYSLSLEPQRLRADAPLPVLPDKALAALPDFPTLAAGEPRTLDLAGAATFRVRADEPGLYRLESTGLLATEGNLRTRVIPSLLRVGENGVGRNFLVQEYLREGDYQLTVATRGQSRGHLGVVLSRTEPVDGGTLRSGVPARATLAEGQALVYRFAIDEAGEYRLESGALGRWDRCRLEDGDGWPLEKPGLAASFRRRFEPGTYRLVLLPGDVEGRRVTRLTRETPPPRFEGHGPHSLPLETRVEHLWLEPWGEAERLPDAWDFRLPAAAEVVVELTAEMEGSLLRQGSGGAPEKVAAVPPSRGWRGRLDAGTYRLEAVCSRKNNRNPYVVSVRPTELLPGQTRVASGSTVIPLSLPGGLVEIASAGPADVRARLYDDKGALVAEGDDRPDDWNFQISERLPAGTYSLRVDPVGAPRAVTAVVPEGGEGGEGSAEAAPAPPPSDEAVESPGEGEPAPAPLPASSEAEDRGGEGEEQGEDGAPTEEGTKAPAGPEPAVPENPQDSGAVPLHQAAAVTVSLSAPQEREGTPLAAPARVEVRPADAVLLHPLSLPAGAGLLLVSARAEEGVGLAVESLAAGGDWQSLGSATGRSPRLRLPLPIPLAGAASALRLRVWSLDRRGNPVALDVAAVSPARAGEEELAVGVALQRVPGADPPVEVVAVDVRRPGLFRVERGAEGLGWSPAPGEPCRPAAEGVIAATGPTLWFAREAADGAEPAPLRASRLLLSPGASRPLPLGLPGRRGRPLVCDLEPPAADAGGPVVVIATSRSGQPGVQILERGQVGADRLSAPSGAALAVGTRSALSVALAPREPVAVAWAADEGSAGADARLTLFGFPPAEGTPAGWGVSGGALAAGGGRVFQLPEGAKELRLALENETVAVLSMGDAVADVFWADGEGFEEAARTSANRLTLLSLGPAEARYTFQVLPAEGEVSSLRIGAPREESRLTAGRLRLRVAPSSGGGTAAVHVRGDEAHALLVAPDGRVARGLDLELPPEGATLTVSHGPGLLLAWVDRTGEEARDLWASAELPAAAVALKLPAVVALEGPVRVWDLAPAEPVFLHLAAAVPSVTLLRRGLDGAPVVEVHGERTSLDAYLPAGPARLALRGVGGKNLSGAAELTVTPVVPTGEGLGPEVLLPPGGARVFSFSVIRQGRVGVGVRAGADVVQCDLLDDAGRGLGSGVVQMPELAAGTYLLVLRAPANGPPVRVRPALAGVEAPAEGPPPEVIQGYREKAREEARGDGPSE